MENPVPATAVDDLRSAIKDVLNSHSAENGSNTADFVLADYLMDCLAAFDRAAQAREKWFGYRIEIGSPPAAAS